MRMGILRFLLFLFSFFVGILTVSAQDKEILFREQTWLGYFNQTRLSTKWGLWTDLHLRFTDNYVDRLGLSILRVAPMYYLNEQSRVTAGYAYITAYNTEGIPNLHELRLWQQIQWFDKKKGFSMMQYFRVEERFRQTLTAGELNEDYTYSWRFRYNFSVTIPLKNKEVVAKTPFLFLNDEIHINAGKSITNNYFDQNRLFVGLGYQFTTHLNTQLGYLFVFQQAASNTFVHIDAIRFFVFHNLDFRHHE